MAVKQTNTPTGTPNAGVIYGFDPSNSNVTNAVKITADGANLVATKSVVVSVTPTITANSAYSAGNVVGGKLTFTNCVDSQKTGLLQSVKIIFKTVRTESYKLALFNADPTDSTFTDKTAPSIAATDVTKLIGIVDLSSPVSGLGTHTIYQIDNIGTLFNIPSGTSLYGVLYTSGTPTYASNAVLASVSIAIAKD